LKKKREQWSSAREEEEGTVKGFKKKREQWS